MAIGLVCYCEALQRMKAIRIAGKTFKGSDDSPLTSTASLLLEQTVQRALERNIAHEVPVLLLVWTVLRWERKLAIVAIERAGVSAQELTVRIDEILSSDFHGCDDPETLDFSRISSISRAALELAEASGCGYVASEHLLQASFESDQASSELLAEFGVTAGHYAECVRELLEE